MARKRKILFIVEAMGGGVFTYIVNLANELVKNYDMYIIYAVHKQTPVDYKDYFVKKIHLIEVRAFERLITLIKDVKAFFEIKIIVVEVHPDLIHIHSSKVGALDRWLFNGKKVPLLCASRGYSFLLQSHGATKRMIYKIVEIINAKRNYITISCSKDEHQETLKLTKNAAYVSKCINTNALKSLIDFVGSTKDHTFTVFMLGRICYQKNLALFNQIAEAMPYVRFLWIGDGKLRDELKALNVEITSWDERKEALRCLLCGDVFSLTNLWEGLLIRLHEAMYMKKLYVANDVIGNRDVIHNGENGFICHEVDEFVQAINKTQTDGVVELIDSAYQDIMDEYNMSVMVERYSKNYMNKLTEKSCGGGQYEIIFVALFYEYNADTSLRGEAVAA